MHTFPTDIIVARLRTVFFCYSPFFLILPAGISLIIFCSLTSSSNSCFVRRLLTNQAPTPIHKQQTPPFKPKVANQKKYSFAIIPSHHMINILSGRLRERKTKSTKKKAELKTRMPPICKKMNQKIIIPRNETRKTVTPG
ncbi:hypothetical protein L873DRAFT_1471655 [Choiromyces venosus 120613-1]|uniref:Uncharacterized protein n=1 Tax=Choiromyces venosus 120613-1 TaxID=1336337 RepID=A0A3N4JCG2_9PEZI|nr:hypothetical protein L873DRAFT_1471655 [Choiromyces venosus 120613-1]